MVLPSRGKYLCEILPRIRQLSSGLWLAEKLREEKKDNVCRCLGVGSQTIKECHFCHEKKYCKKPCAGKGKLLPILAKRTDIIHFKNVFGQKITYEGRKYVVLTHDDIIAVENDNGLCAVGSMVIVKLCYADKIGAIIVPDTAKQNEGDFWGEVASVGTEFADKSLRKGDKLCYLRSEGYRFRAYNGNGREEFYAVKEKWCYGVERA